MLKRNFVEKKIDLIQQELVNLSELKNFTMQEIAGDFYKYNTLERLLEKIIMRAVDINQYLLREIGDGKNDSPVTYRETFLRLVDIDILPKKFAEQIAQSVGLRNILAHDYDDETISYEKIYNSIDDCLKDYYKYCEYILKVIKD